MKNKISISSIIWLVIALLTVALVFNLRANRTATKPAQKEIDISEFIEELQIESEALFSSLLPVKFNDKSAEYAYKIKNEKWYLICFTKDQITFWNSNKFGIDSSFIHRNDYPLFYTFGDDYYVIFSNSNQAFLAYRLSNDGKLSTRLIALYPELEGYELSALNTTTKVSPTKSLIFNFHPQENSYAWIVLVCLLLTLLFQFFHTFKNQRVKEAVIVSAFLIAVDVIIHYVFRETKLVYSSIYQPDVYASSNLLSSLGSLVNHIIASIPLVFLYRHFAPQLKKRFWFNGLSMILVFFASDLILGVIENIVLDSNISFDFQDLYGISWYTFTAVSLIGLMLFGLFTFILSTQFNKNLKSTLINKIPIFIGLIVFIAFQMTDGRRSFTSLIAPTVIVAAVVAIDYFLKKNRQKIIGLSFLGLIICSIFILNAQITREKRFIELYASKLIANQDLRTEYILKSFEDQLAQEFLVPEDYENFTHKKDVVENRIKRLYFSNYLEKYDLRLISFDSVGVNINSNSLYTYEDLNKVYNQNTKRTVSNYFYQINNPSLISGYIGKYENCDLEGHFGATFILLQPRLIQSDFLYPEAFANQQKKDLVKLDDYAYAIYFKNRLISQKGSYNYSLNEPPEAHSEHLGWHFSGYHHYIFSDIDNFQVILSKKVNIMTSWLSTLTFCFTFLLPIAVLLVSFAYFYDPSNSIFSILKGKYLSTRIQASLTLILLVGLLFSVYIIISYISSNYNTRLERELLSNVKNISGRFQNKIDLAQKLKNEEQRQLILNEESSAYKVDLNLFDSNGKLLNTTKPYLIQDEVLGSYMNPKAYDKMKVNHYSQLLLQEELEGSDYLSAYVPLFNGKNEVIGYLNIPYFAKNAELNQQISTVIVNVINIYFLMLLGGTFIALIISKRISKPLLLIQERFAQTELGGQNELIVYNREDEIGQLVKQYNKMVLELEASAAQLAETEREGAWREMAKQVAHEIKNPLTPMKLSIQHLQRAYEKGGDKLDELFVRTSKLLIEQIDSLSAMASEFSSFAKMPEDKYERFNLADVLNATIELFQRSENVTIQKELQENIFVFADPEQMRRVFTNLIKNGIQAIPEGINGEINVQLFRENENAVCIVRDNGRGIPKENRNKVFVPNFSTKNSGMGLGLAISRKVIETAKGSIRFSSEINKGTSFTITLPCYDKD